MAIAPESLARILIEFGYQPAWVDATFMRDGYMHPAFQMAAQILRSRQSMVIRSSAEGGSQNGKESKEVEEKGLLRNPE